MKLVAPSKLSSGRRRGLVLGLLVMSTAAAGLLAPLVWARPNDPSREDRRIAILVSALMDRKHLSELHVNDETSRRAMEMFFKSLDPMKLYFYQSDIDEFAKESENIDDYVKNGDVRLAKRIYDRFLQRVNERIAMAERLLDEKHDFTLDEEIVTDPEKMAYATSPAEADERWRKRVKYDLLIHLADDMEYDEAVEKLHKRYHSIARYQEQTNNDELLERFLTSLTMSFDPHSSYMSPSTLENFNIMMRLELNGIGASLQSEYGETIVRRIVPGGAADKDNRLKINDVIVGVGQGTDGGIIDIVDMKINDVVQLIRGKPGTIVRLEVTLADKSGKEIYDITRARIELKDSEARSEILERLPDGTDPHAVADEDAPLAADAENGQAEGESPAPTAQIIEHGPAPDGSVIRIGVIDLPSFYMDMKGRREGRPDFKSTTRDVRRLLEEFNRQKVDLVIMDLRFNGGGSLPESVDTTGLFIDQGPVVQVKGPDGRVQPYRDDQPGSVWSGPLMVLINKFSASASEIFAGAIQDYGRGIIVGDHATHGKGTVQELVPLGRRLLPIHDAPNLGALKLTIQQFYRPSGDSTQNRGVVSDIELPYRTTYWEVGESDLDYALEFDRVKPLQHENYSGANPRIIQELAQRSKGRCDKSEFFVAEQRKIERYLERKESPTATLNQEKFLAEREKVNSEKDQKEIYDKLQDEDRPIFPSTPYNEEVIAIAIDYLNLLGQNRVAVAK